MYRVLLFFYGFCYFYYCGCILANFERFLSTSCFSASSSCLHFFFLLSLLCFILLLFPVSLYFIVHISLIFLSVDLSTFLCSTFWLLHLFLYFFVLYTFYLFSVSLFCYFTYFYYLLLIWFVLHRWHLSSSLYLYISFFLSLVSVVLFVSCPSDFDSDKTIVLLFFLNK